MNTINAWEKTDSENQEHLKSAQEKKHDIN